MLRTAFLLLSISMITGCKIAVWVAEGGQVESLSGTYSCSADSPCEIPVKDSGFIETFTAIPDEGFYFSHWAKGDKHLCGGSKEECHLTTENFAGNDDLMSILESDQTFYLRPIFLQEAELADEPASVCFNEELYEIPFVAEGEYFDQRRYGPPDEGNETFDVYSKYHWRLAGEAEFNGHNALVWTFDVNFDLEEDYWGEYSAYAPGSYSVVNTDKLRSTHLGFVATGKSEIDGVVSTFVTESFIEPGLVDRFDLEPGEGYRNFYRRRSVETMVTGSDQTVKERVQTNDDERIYRGLQEVEVIAGVFLACRFDEFGVTTTDWGLTHLNQGVFSYWYDTKTGFLVKQEWRVDGYIASSRELVSTVINGIPVSGIED